MASSSLFLILGSVLLLPSVVLCSFPWPDNVTQHKGYIEVNRTHGVNLFYWFFESRSDPANDPLVVWIAGGPGCSNLLAIFVENGPFLLPEGHTEPVLNNFGWNSFANLLYIDHPAGTGFSYVTNNLEYVVYNERTIATQLWTMIQEFYNLYPKYSRLDLYIVGESFAGHYVPATAQVIVESNSIYSQNLKGIGIGNGWVDPVVQYNAYAKYAYMEQLINEPTSKDANVMYEACKRLLDLHLYPLAFPACQHIESFILEASVRNDGRSINLYDITKTCDVPPLCYDQSRVTRFLNRQDVQADLGVTRTWESCTTSAELLLLGNWVHEFANATGAVLNAGRRVVVYSGKNDFICNYIGGSEWTNATRWNQQAAFTSAATVDWLVNGAVAGQVKSGGGMTFIAVDGAGHMVPMDQPANALDILDRLVHNISFAPT